MEKKEKKIKQQITKQQELESKLNNLIRITQNEINEIYDTIFSYAILFLIFFLTIVLFATFVLFLRCLPCNSIGNIGMIICIIFMFVLLAMDVVLIILKSKLLRVQKKRREKQQIMTMYEFAKEVLNDEETYDDEK